MISFLLVNSSILRVAPGTNIPPVVIIYESIYKNSTLPNEHKQYNSELLTELAKEQYTIIEDPEGRFTAIVSNSAFEINALEGTASIFQEASQLGLEGFDTTTDLGKRALALIRGNNPHVDYSLPAKQPAIGVNVDCYFERTGTYQNFSVPLPFNLDKQGFFEPRDPKLVEKYDKNRLSPEPKGPIYQVYEPFIHPYNVRVIESEPKKSPYRQGESLAKAQALIQERLENAIAQYRLGADSYVTVFLSKHLGDISNRIPGEFSVNELPEWLKKGAMRQFQDHYKEYGFNSQEEVSSFFENGGKIRLKALLRVSVQEARPNDPGKASTGVGKVLPLPGIPNK